jgi:hypothetical protein
MVIAIDTPHTVQYCRHASEISVNILMRKVFIMDNKIEWY